MVLERDPSHWGRPRALSVSWDSVGPTSESLGSAQATRCFMAVSQAGLGPRSGGGLEPWSVRVRMALGVARGALGTRYCVVIARLVQELSADGAVAQWLVLGVRRGEVVGSRPRKVKF